MHYDISTDKAGQLRTDVFYCVRNVDYDLLSTSERASLAIVERKRANAVDPIWLWAEVVEQIDSNDPKVQCPKGRHLSQRRYSAMKCDVFGGPELPDFVIDSSWGHLLVVKSLAARIRKTPLSGIDFIEVNINLNQSKKREPALMLMQLIGRNCERHLIIRDDQNRCVYCRKGKVVCPGCGKLFFACEKCGKRSWVGARESSVGDERKLVLEPHSNEGGVLDGRNWDGSDCVSSHLSYYLSRRAFQWLVSIHSGPLIGVPARFCVDGMSDAQLARMKTVMDPVTVTESQ